MRWQSRSLLSMARLNIAISRLRPQAAGERELSRRPSASTDASGRSGTLFQGSSGSEGVGFSAEMFVSRRSRPLPPQRQISVDRPGTISRKGAERRSGPLRDCGGAAAIQRIAGTGREYPSVGSAAPGAGTSGIFFSVTTFMTLFLLWPSFRLSIGARPFKAKPTSTQTASPDSPPP
jgi:hypothetical protein